MSESNYNPLQGRVVGLGAIARGIKSREKKIENIHRAIEREQQALAVAQRELREKQEDYTAKEAELIALLAEPESGPEPEEKPEEFPSLTGVTQGWYVSESRRSEDPSEVFRVYVSGYVRRYSVHTSPSRLMDPDFYDVKSPFVRVEKPDWVGEEYE